VDPVTFTSGSQGVQSGDGNVQFNFFGGSSAEPRVAGAGTVVVGDLPQEPTAFQPRSGLMEALERQPQGRVRVVFALTGIRGVGKTHYDRGAERLTTMRASSTRDPISSLRKIWRR
jgi:hypothetical protein